MTLSFEKIISILDSLKISNSTSVPSARQNADIASVCKTLMNSWHTLNSNPKFNNTVGDVAARLIYLLDVADINTRIVVDECVNSLIKCVPNCYEHTARILIGLISIMKTSNGSRSIQGALWRFAELSHFFRPQKCKLYVMSFFPIILRVVEMKNEGLMETLSISLPKIMTNMELYAPDNYIENLLNAFMKCLYSEISDIRRSASSCIVTTCQFSRDPLHFFNFVASRLIERNILVKCDARLNRDSIAGILLCFRQILPHLENLNGRHLDSEAINDLVILHAKIYSICLYYCSCQNVNCVVASLETLNQLLDTNFESFLRLLKVVREMFELLEKHNDTFSFDSIAKVIPSENDLLFGGDPLLEQLTLEQHLPKLLDVRSQHFANNDESVESDMATAKSETNRLEENVDRDTYSDISSSNSSALVAENSICGDVDEFSIPLEKCALFLAANFLNNATKRISIKMLTLQCLAKIFRIHPQCALSVITIEENENCTQSPSVSIAGKKVLNCVLEEASSKDDQVRGLTRVAVAHLLTSVISSQYNALEFMIQANQRVDSLVDFITAGCADDVTVCVKHSLLAASIVLPAILDSAYNKEALKLIRILFHLRSHSYWLIKVILADVIGKIPFRLLFAIDEYSGEYQNRFFEKIVYPFLGNEDDRVAEAAANACVSLVKNIHCPEFPDGQNSTLYEFASELLREKYFDVEKFEISWSTKSKKLIQPSFELPLSLITSKLINLIKSTSNERLKYGCYVALLKLSESYPPKLYFASWHLVSEGVGFNFLNDTVVTLFIAHSKMPIDFYINATSLCLALISGLYEAVFSYPNNDENKRMLFKNGADNARNHFASYLLNIVDVLKRAADSVQQSKNAPLLKAANLSFEKGSLLRASWTLRKKKSSPSSAKCSETLEDYFRSACKNYAVTLKPDPNKKFVKFIAIIAQSFGVIFDYATASESACATEQVLSFLKSTATIAPVENFNCVAKLMKSSFRTNKISRWLSTEKRSNIEQSQCLSNIETNMEISGRSSNEVTNILPSNRHLGASQKEIFENVSELSDGPSDRNKMYKSIEAINEEVNNISKWLSIEKVNSEVSKISNWLSSEELSLGNKISKLLPIEKIVGDASKMSKSLQNKGETTETNELSKRISDENRENGVNLSHKLLSNEENNRTVGSDLYSVAIELPLQKTNDVISRARCDISSSKINKRSKNMKPGNASTFQVSQFEEMILLALHTYVVTSDTTLQAELLRIFCEIAKLKINYCLFESEATFQNTILTQLKCLEEGKLRSEDSMMKRFFKFLTLLSNPKANFVPVISVSKVIQIFDSLMISSAKFDKARAIQPIVEKLFLDDISIGAEISSQKEILFSTLMRMANEKEILRLISLVIEVENEASTNAEYSTQITEYILNILNNAEDIKRSNIDTFSIFRILLILPSDSYTLKNLLHIFFQFEKRDVSVSFLSGLVAVLLRMLVDFKETFIIESIEKHFAIKNISESKSAAELCSKILNLLQFAFSYGIKNDDLALESVIWQIIFTINRICSENYWPKVASHFKNMMTNDDSLCMKITRKCNLLYAKKPSVATAWYYLISLHGNMSLPVEIEKHILHFNFISACKFLGNCMKVGISEKLTSELLRNIFFFYAEYPVKCLIDSVKTNDPLRVGFISAIEKDLNIFEKNAFMRNLLQFLDSLPRDNDLKILQLCANDCFLYNQNAGLKKDVYFLLEKRVDSLINKPKIDENHEDTDAAFKSIYEKLIKTRSPCRLIIKLEELLEDNNYLIACEVSLKNDFDEKWYSNNAKRFFIRNNLTNAQLIYLANKMNQRQIDLILSSKIIGLSCLKLFVESGRIFGENHYLFTAGKIATFENIAEIIALEKECRYYTRDSITDILYIADAVSEYLSIRKNSEEILLNCHTLMQFGITCSMVISQLIREKTPVLNIIPFAKCVTLILNINMCSKLITFKELEPFVLSLWVAAEEILEEPLYAPINNGEITVKGLLTLSKMVNLLIDSIRDATTTFYVTLKNWTTVISRVELLYSYCRLPNEIWKLVKNEEIVISESYIVCNNISETILQDSEIVPLCVERMSFIGWKYKCQFEEWWVLLLTPLAMTLENVCSSEEKLAMSSSIRISLDGLVQLLTQTSLYPTPGDTIFSQVFHISRNRFKDIANKVWREKLHACEVIMIREMKSSKTKCLSEMKNMNLERLRDYNIFGNNQISVEYFIERIRSVENADLSLTNIYQFADDYLIRQKNLEEIGIDLRSCVYFLEEFVSQWIKNDDYDDLEEVIIRSKLAISDFLTEGFQFATMLDEFLFLYERRCKDANNLVREYLILGICKSAAICYVLENYQKQKYAKVVTVLTTGLRNTVNNIRHSALRGLLYLLESLYAPKENTEFFDKIIFIASNVVYDNLNLKSLSKSESNVTICVITIAFFLLEHFDNAFNRESQMIVTLRDCAIAFSKNNATLNEYNCVIQGLYNGILTCKSKYESSIITSLAREIFAEICAENVTLPMIQLLVAATYAFNCDNAKDPSDNEASAMEKCNMICDRLRKGTEIEVKFICAILPKMLIDFLRPANTLNKAITEFLSSPAHIRTYLSQVVFHILQYVIEHESDSIRQDWLLSVIRNQMIVKSNNMEYLKDMPYFLTCIFVASSKNPFVAAMFHALNYELCDSDIFKSAAIQFYNQLDCVSDKAFFVSAFQDASNAYPNSDFQHIHEELSSLHETTKSL